MAVYDRWHKARPRPSEPLCREHGKTPTGDHGDGDRWQVRWRDEAGRQCKQNFARRADADSSDASTRAQLHAGTYIDPARAAVTFRAYAEDWRTTRNHDVKTAAGPQPD